jgi:UDP-sulfoquinovose synthase
VPETKKRKRIIVVGGDGFCGWPTALHLADDPDNEVKIIDDLSRRDIDTELGVQSLTPIQSIEKRLATWKKLEGSAKAISFDKVDVSDESQYDKLKQVIAQFQPDVIVHFGEIRAAPYSMISAAHKLRTIRRNVLSTNLLLFILSELGLDTHFVHLGTMGVYGYGIEGDPPIPEGYLKIRRDTPKGEIEMDIRHPSKTGSIYHMTKDYDQVTIEYNARMEGRRATDLHQGIVWGVDTEETKRHPDLINRLDYDQWFGTAFNRFVIQAAVGHDITVHGSGGQKRGFIHITDTTRCIEKAIKNPPKAGERPTIRNQVTEVHKINDLAEMIGAKTGAKVRHMPNPRKEAAANELNVIHDSFRKIGLTDPVTLSEGLMREVFDVAKKYKDRVDLSKIVATTLWNGSEAQQLQKT